MRSPGLRAVSLTVVAGVVAALVTASTSLTASTVQVGGGLVDGASIDGRPDIVTPSVIRAVDKLATVLQVSPEGTDSNSSDKSGRVFTPPDLLAKRRLEAPQISVSRELETSRDGDYTGFPNQLEVSASAPTDQNDAYCVVGLKLRLTQFSPLLKGDVNAANVLAALRSGPAGSVTPDSLEVYPQSRVEEIDRDGYARVTSGAKADTITRNFEEGRYMVDGGPVQAWKAASSQDMQRFVADLTSTVDCIIQAFAKQPLSGRALSAICASCIVTGSASLPGAPGLRVVSVLGGDVGRPPSALVALELDEHIVWRYDTVEWTALEPLHVATDTSGNLFFRYNPGRYDGVVVIGWRSGQVQTHGSLPEAGSYFGKFYNANVLDVDHDGLLDIAVHEHYCAATCPGDKVFYWTGSDYVER
jgi:hypothetical protein